MTTSESVNELASALAKAQGEMKPATKDATNPHFKSKYADLAANVEAARGPLAKNGLSVVQEPTMTEGGVAVATRLLHGSGQWIQFDPLTVPLSKLDAHGVGSATTYARRYALGAALGLVAEDDDGNAAVTKSPVVPATVALPPNFAERWADLQAVADNGVQALQSAWAQHDKAFQQYLQSRHKAQWDKLKDKAAAVDAKKAAAVPA